MTVVFDGTVTKLSSVFESPVRYSLGELNINELIGHSIKIQSRMEKRCIGCERVIKKTFGQGYCYPCFQSLARCDFCIVNPEKCHYAEGTCREPAWGEANCLIDHVVYLANTSGVKVGITRAHQKHTRWIDQGALSALELGVVPGRLESGRVEVKLKSRFADKTNWRALLTGKDVAVDLLQEKERLMSELPDLFSDIGGAYTEGNGVVSIEYPVQSYLSKARSGNLDTLPECSGILHGVRGQYLFIGDTGINVRKYQGYLWTIHRE